MKINSNEFRVPEGEHVDRKSGRPRSSSRTARRAIQRAPAQHVALLSAQQHLLYASNRYALLLIFQAMDAAGKDGMIKHVMSGVNPQGCQVFSFKHPSASELEHDFLWRTTRDLPERGRIGIFNRSYYEEVLIVRVHPEILRSEGLPDELSMTKTIWKRALPLHRGSGEAPPPQRHPHHQVLPAPLQGRAAQALSGAHRRSEQELEIQPGRHRRAEILEAIHEGLRGLPGRDQHRGPRPGMSCPPTTRRTPG